MSITCFIRYEIDPTKREEFEQKERFLLREDRLFLRLASAPHAPMVRP